MSFLCTGLNSDVNISNLLQVSQVLLYIIDRNSGKPATIVYVNRQYKQECFHNVDIVVFSLLCDPITRGWVYSISLSLAETNDSSSWTRCTKGRLWRYFYVDDISRSRVCCTGSGTLYAVPNGLVLAPWIGGNEFEPKAGGQLSSFVKKIKPQEGRHFMETGYNM